MKPIMPAFKAFIFRRFAMVIKTAFILFFLIIFMLMPGPSLFAADDKTKNATTQQIGGLLFDVDEGVKVEQGPGGSVYVKSNREEMQEKFKAIDSRLETIEKRTEDVEKDLIDLRKQLKLAKAPAGTENAASSKQESTRKVLST